MRWMLYMKGPRISKFLTYEANPLTKKKIFFWHFFPYRKNSIESNYPMVFRRNHMPSISLPLIIWPTASQSIDFENFCKIFLKYSNETESQIYNEKTDCPVPYISCICKGKLNAFCLSIWLIMKWFFFCRHSVAKVGGCGRGGARRAYALHKHALYIGQIVGPWKMFFTIGRDAFEDSQQ